MTSPQKNIWNNYIEEKTNENNENINKEDSNVCFIVLVKKNMG